MKADGNAHVLADFYPLPNDAGFPGDAAEAQLELFENVLTDLAAQDERVLRLIQIPGIGLIIAVALLAAIGDITRFPDAQHLVGYAGLGGPRPRQRPSASERPHTCICAGAQAQVQVSPRPGARTFGTSWSKPRRAPHARTRIGRLPWRAWSQESAGAKPWSPHWHLRASASVARKLLVSVWHVLTDQVADRFANEQQVACALFAHAYKVGIKNLPDGQSALQPAAACRVSGRRQFTRDQLDRLNPSALLRAGLGGNLTHIPWGSNTFKLPPSKLAS